MTDLHIQSTDKIDQPWLHIFLYGDSGSSKTTSASTMPAPLFLVPANEGSELSLRDKAIPYIKLGRANGKPVRATVHMNEVLTELETRYAKMLASTTDAEAHKHFPWQTIVVESLTHYGDMVIDDITDGGVKAMDMRMWGKLANHYRQIQSRLRRMDVHVVFTALAKVLDGDSGAAQGVPSISGSMSIKMPTSCDIVGYTECIPSSRGGGDPTYRVHFRKKGPYLARARFRGFPAHMDSFDFSEVAHLCGLD